jgi:hypothetical protein
MLEDVPDSVTAEAFENGFGVSFGTKTKHVMESKQLNSTLPGTVIFSPANMGKAVGRSIF